MLWFTERFSDKLKICADLCDKTRVILIDLFNLFYVLRGTADNFLDIIAELLVKFLC